MIRILTGDCRDVLSTLPAESVHCVVTSPPYWGLRDYGTAQWNGGDTNCDHLKPAAHGYSPFDTSTLGPKRDGVSPSNTAHADGAKRQQFTGVCGKCGATRIDRQIGLEASYQDYVAEMVAVFREVRRVLRPDGTLWLNLGDSYAGSWSGNSMRPEGGKQRSGNPGFQPLDDRVPARGGVVPAGLKPKDLCGIPWRVAFALQADGWWLRQDIIWSKSNPMPESVTDRCTKAHEYLFLLSKSERYYYDAEAIKEAAVAGNDLGAYDGGPQRLADGRNANEGRNFRNGRASGNKSHKGVTEYEHSDSEEHRTKAGLLKISETAYLKRNRRSVWEVATAPFSEAHFATFPPALIEPCIKAGCPEGGTVLDPFGGAGTTAMVADRLKRNAVLIELNPAYAAMTQRRIEADAGMFAAIAAE